MSATERTRTPNNTNLEPIGHAAQAPGEARPRIRGRKVLPALGILVVCARAAASHWFFYVRGIVFSDDARLPGHLTDLAPEINSRLAGVLVSEGQFVRRGAGVFRLDSSTPRICPQCPPGSSRRDTHGQAYGIRQGWIPTNGLDTCVMV